MALWTKYLEREIRRCPFVSVSAIKREREVTYKPRSYCWLLLDEDVDYLAILLSPLPLLLVVSSRDALDMAFIWLDRMCSGEEGKKRRGGCRDKRRNE